MDLWIRSQDRAKLTKVNSNIGLKYNDNKTIIANYIPDFTDKYDGSYDILGTYKSRERALEILDVALLEQCDNWLRCPTNKLTKQDVELNPYIIDNIRENTLYFQRKINELIDTINELKRGN